MENDAPITVERLDKINAGIREMVQFGESKNGILLGANVAILYNVAIKAISFANFRDATLSSLALTFFTASSLILIYSIFPKLRFTERMNPLFFGSIAKVDKDAYLKLCRELTEEDLVRHYSEQIHTNSLIAARKFREFQWAVACALVSYAAFAALYVISLKGL